MYMEEDLKIIDDIRYKAEQRVSQVSGILEKLIEFYDMESLKSALENLKQAEKELEIDLELFKRKVE